ncbi:MAG TPA: hypothetical protein VJM33_06415, partial [Microthrixaceae bacterium]|nr:hypothetical protein [Microthrixaceae bacterium]
ALVSPGGSDHLLALALSVALLVGACSIGWEGMTSSNGLRFVALMAYAGLGMVALVVVLGLHKFAEHDESPDLQGLAGPFDPSVIEHADRLLELKELEATGNGAGSTNGAGTGVPASPPREEVGAHGPA